MPGVPDDLKGRSLTRIGSWSRNELETLLDLADELKAERARRPELRLLPGRTIGLIFHKPSTRTRVAFEVGIAELGGMALFLPAAELQLARGESYRDTALVLSRFLSALMIRTFAQDEVEEFAFSDDPVHLPAVLSDAFGISRSEGRRLLTQVRQTFLEEGNAFDAALAALDLSISHLQEGKTAEVRELADEMVTVFRNLEVAREVYPPVGSCVLARSWIGLEAFMPDELPVMGPVPGVDGLLVAAGFSGHGFALSPMVGDVLARLALGRDALEHLWRDLRFDRPALAGS